MAARSFKRRSTPTGAATSTCRRTSSLLKNGATCRTGTGDQAPLARGRLLHAPIHLVPLDDPHLSHGAIRIDPERDVRRFPERILPRDPEDVVLPVLQLALRGTRLQRQPAVAHTKGRGSKQAVRVGAGIAIERQGGMRAGDALALLHLPRRARAVREPL